MIFFHLRLTEEHYLQTMKRRERLSFLVFRLFFAALSMTCNGMQFIPVRPARDRRLSHLSAAV